MGAAPPAKPKHPAVEAEPVEGAAGDAGKGRTKRRVLRSSAAVDHEQASGALPVGRGRERERMPARPQKESRALARAEDLNERKLQRREKRELRAREQAELETRTLRPGQLPRLALPAEASFRRRRPWFTWLLVASLLMVVVAPTVAVATFYLFFAAPQYAATSQFSVRGAAIQEDGDVPSILSSGGPPSLPEIADSLILVDYIHSREVVDSLIENVDFLEIYSRPGIDEWYRLDPTLPIEDVVDYWQMMSAIEFDETSMIMSLSVRAFTPEDAERVANHVIRLSENLVNELSSRARNDSVKLAREEVALAEARFRNARTALAEFRDQEFELDPTATAEARQGVVARLEQQLAEQEALLNALSATMSANSPRVIYVRNQIEALRDQIAEQRTNVARPEEGVAAAEPVLTRRLSRFEELEAERLFAQEAYTSSLAALETARIEAAKQQRYLAVFVRPAVPEEALYPQGLRWTLVVFGGLFLGWGIAALVAGALRDRMA